MVYAILAFGKPSVDQLLANIVVDSEAPVLLGGGDVTENELGQLAAFALPPDAQDVFHALVDLAAGFIGQHGVNDPLVQPQLPAVRGDLEHVVLLGVDHPGMYFRRPFGQRLNHILLHFRGLGHHVVIHRLRGGQVQLGRRS